MLQTKLLMKIVELQILLFIVWTTLDGEPDPWFEFDKARVDARQFDAVGASA